MSRVYWVLSVLAVVLLAMGFAAANAGERVTVSLGLLTFYRVPVALVAFCGLFVGMLVMFATGIHSDLKIRRILRDRLAAEAKTEQAWIDRNQQDLFSEGPGVSGAVHGADDGVDHGVGVGEGADERPEGRADEAARENGGRT